ncbi:MAG: hypothetical protein RRY69_07300 [Oscillospiraceae bacterium]
MNGFRQKSACAIGIVGGSDGPTSAFIGKKRINDKQMVEMNRKEKEFLDFAATQVVANFRPFTEIDEFLVAKYKAVPYTLRENELCTLKANVIMNRFREVLDLPAPLPPKPTKKQLLEYAENDTTFKQARDYPAEKLGLVMKAYKIPSETDKNGIVELEMTTECMVINNTSREITDELLLWQGISQDDIDNKTTRFVTYVHTLRNLGILHYAK